MIMGDAGLRGHMLVLRLNYVQQRERVPPISRMGEEALQAREGYS